MIRQRLRLLEIFLVVIKAINNITDLATVFDPQYCEDTIKAINVVAKYNKTTCSYDAPNVAANLGTYLRQTGNLLITKCIRKKNKEKRKYQKIFKNSGPRP